MAIGLWQLVKDNGKSSAKGQRLRVRADLQDVSVLLLYLVRSGQARQGSGHLAFWQEYLQGLGAEVEAVERVFGDR